MNQCLNTLNIITNISKYLTYQSIIQFSLCNKTLEKLLDPEKNNVINNIFMQTVLEKYFQFPDDDNNNLIKKKNLLDIYFKSKLNWKKFLKELELNFKAYSNEDKAKKEKDCSNEDIAKKEKDCSNEDKTKKEKDYSNEDIAKKVKDCFQIHMYLPDLRKEDSYLEFESSSIHQIINYDFKFRNACTFNYYNKFINNEYLLNSINWNKEADNNNNNDTNCNDYNNKKIEILKKGLFFEKELLNFNIIFKDFINNNNYKIFILDDVINYKYEKLDYIYLNSFNYNYNNNINNYNWNIINFLLWINHSFILYGKFVYEYIISIFNRENVDIKLKLLEFTQKLNELINCGLLLNSNFDNINIIINHFDIYKTFSPQIKKKVDSNSSNCSYSNNEKSSTSNESESDDLIYEYGKFSLYKLFITIIKKNVHEKLFIELKDKFKILSKNYFIEEFQKKNDDKKKDNYNDLMCDYDYVGNDNLIIDEGIGEDNSDEDYLLNEETSLKDLIESYLKCEVDMIINEKNSKAINHTEIIVSEQYECIENILIDELENTLKKYIDEKESPFQLYDIIERITKCNTNNPNIFLNNDSLIIIRRTKKRMMEKSIQILFNYVLSNIEKDFHEYIKINGNNEKEISKENTKIKNKKEYQCDLSDLSKNKRLKVAGIIEREINNLKTFLEEQNIKAYENQNEKEKMEKLINDYVENDEIPYVLLMKKIISYYYKELGLYEDKNERIVSFLTNKCKSSQKSEDLNSPFNSTNIILNKDLLPINVK